MIDNRKIKELILSLDEALREKGTSRDLTLFGSGPLLLQGISRNSRTTVDLDIVKPEIDLELQLIAAEVGEVHGLDLTWLNSAGFIFSRNFPKDWEKRAITIYKGSALIIKSLSKKDLIATKLNALCTRNLERDFEDMIDLAPSKKDLEFAKDWILGLTQNELTSNEVNQNVDRVLSWSKSRGQG